MRACVWVAAAACALQGIACESAVPSVLVFADGGDPLRCSPETVLSAPASTCSAAAPCTTPSSMVTTPIELPTCRGGDVLRGTYDDSPPVVSLDPVNGETRAACSFTPTSDAPLPLLVFFHGSEGSADTLYISTALRGKALASELSPDTLGYAIVSVQGRNLHWVDKSFDGSHHDNYFGDLASPSSNPDFRYADAVIDRALATGKIDARRIYVGGWSNGGFFAELYAIARHATPTPGGHRVAAAAVYAAGDPLSGTASFETPASCHYANAPHSDVPILVVHRDCDALVACDLAQQTQLGLPPTNVGDWLRRAAAPDGADDPNVRALLIDARGAQAITCTAACTPLLGLLNHAHWPDGINDAGGQDREAYMLAFLRDHPLD